MREFYFHKELRGVELCLAARLERYKKVYTHSNIIFVNFTMPSSQIERKLAAIMFTDIAGYTEQMSKDEAVVIRLIQKQK